MKRKVKEFLDNEYVDSKLVALASGLYPFLHYYNSNLSLVGSKEQLIFLIVFCLLLPQIIMAVSPFFVKLLKLEIIEKYRFVGLNIGIFISLLIILIFHFNKWMSLALAVTSLFIGLLLYKHLKKIIILQFLLVFMSFVTLIPKVYFAVNQDNQSWAKLPDSMIKAKLNKRPNIFLIQPDGYVNLSEINKEPYSYNNTKFENWLENNDFINYPGFKSNYYSTLTSNASMFAMKHHYYSNTDKNTLKTHKANHVIVGDENNVLRILKNNGYKTHLLTDNSFFLIDRTPLLFDFCNVPKSGISYYDTGAVNGVDILEDFETILDTLSKQHNFFFIEKTIPSHIMYTKRRSKGKEQERIEYFERLELANTWLKELVANINKFDKDAMIIIVADHGGYVGLDYTLEVINRKLDSKETMSCFSSMLSIKWPQDLYQPNLEFKSNVNLFRKVFYSLSNDNRFITNLESNTSYMPLKFNGTTDYYEYINEEGEVVFNKLSN